MGDRYSLNSNQWEEGKLSKLCHILVYGVAVIVQHTCGYFRWNFTWGRLFGNKSADRNEGKEKAGTAGMETNVLRKIEKRLREAVTPVGGGVEIIQQTVVAVSDVSACMVSTDKTGLWGGWSGTADIVRSKSTQINDYLSPQPI